MSDDTPPTPAALLRQGQRTDGSGNDLLRAGLLVGAMGAGGALLGAVCPLCVVLTPALVGAGAVQKLRAVLLGRRARALVPAPLEVEPRSA
jgi:hypothetical protein